MPQTALDRLREYIKRTKLKQFEIAHLIGINNTHLSKIMSGQRRPGLDTAALIERRTGIPAVSWSERKRGRPRKSNAGSENKAPVGNEISHA